jgi:acyl-CoA dehydrogenase
MSDPATLDGSIESVVAQYLSAELSQESERDAERGVWLDGLWRGAEAQGFTLPAVAEVHNGSGGNLSDEAAVVRAVARTATPLPIAETAVAGWALSLQGQQVPAGPLSIAPVRFGERLVLRGGRVHGTVTRIPWGRNVGAVVSVANERLVLLDPLSSTIRHGMNLANEPRDTLCFDGSLPLFIGEPIDSDLIMKRGAAVRATQLAAAAAAVLELTVNYVRERVQFGKSLGSLQAIQQQVARASSLVAAAHIAAQYGYCGNQSPNRENRAMGHLCCAIAKSRASDAAGIVAAIAHQAHGAIGFTEDYSLRRWTRRIQSWRTEFGSEAAWSLRVGERILDAGGAAAWPIITSVGY